MTISIFQCNSCNRTIELNELNSTITFVNKCIITHHCMGKLTKVGQRVPGVMGKPTPVVDGLQDYSSKKRLYQHEQKLSTSQWKINHDLDTNPTVIVYLNSVSSTGKQGYEQLDSDLYYVNIIDSKNIILEFDANYIGIAHVIARSTSNIQTITVKETDTFTQVSANNILTIATPIIPNDGEIKPLNVSYIHPITSQQIDNVVNFIAHKFENKIALFNTPWRNIELITWNFRIYRLHSIRLSTLMSNIGATNGVPLFFPNNSDFIILTSNSPYETDVDININVVNGNDLIGDINNNQTNNNEYYVDSTIPFLYPPGVKIAKLITEE